MDPAFLCDLLDGLLSIDGSLYRAWTLRHSPTGRQDRQRRERLRLDYLTWGQSQMLMLELVNGIDRLNTNVTLLGGGKAKPHPILPPGVRDATEPRHVGGKHMSFHSFMDASQAFLQNL